MATNTEFTERRVAAISSDLSRHLEIGISRADDAEFWAVEGERYVEFASGIAVTNAWHRHPKMLARVRDKLDHVTNTSL